jgi:hypothetical protein
MMSRMEEGGWARQNRLFEGLLAVLRDDVDERPVNLTYIAEFW